MDAFKLSGNDLLGSARGVAIGGAFGALGGDLTGIAQNPAGIGVYRSSEIVGTLNFSSVNVESNTLGSITKDSKFNFNFNNIAYVSYTPLSGDVRSFNFGFAYNRLKNFGKSYQSYRKGLTSSLTDYIANLTTQEANVSPDDLYSYDNNGKYDPWPYEQEFPWISVLGYNGGLIEDTGDRYVSLLQESETVERTYSISELGHIDTYDFTMGTNILDMLYLGLTFSFTDIRYNLDSRHTEEFEFGGGFDLDNRLTTEGAGYQVSLGAIFRPVDELRIGVAYHSPTWYNITDYYYAETDCGYDLNGEWKNFRTHTPNNAATEYKLRTPDRWVMSVAGILGTKAIISLDYEYSNYSGMKLEDIDGYGNTYIKENDRISKRFTGASSLKMGLEYNLTPQVALRAGYSWMQSPLEKSFKSGNKTGDYEVFNVGTITAYTLDGDVNYFSCGAGYRFTPNFYMDLAFSFKAQANQLYTYSPSKELEVSSVPAELKNNTSKGLLTLGYKF